MDELNSSWGLVKASWRVLRRDGEILIFPLLSFISSALIFGGALFLLNKTGALGYFKEIFESKDDSLHLMEKIPLQFYGYLFIFYLVNYFSITFFNVALISCTLIRMGGQDPSVLDGVVYSVKRIKYIFGWAVFESTVGVVLIFIQNRIKIAGRWIAYFLNFSWSLASYLAVPIFVAEEKGPVETLKRSIELFRGSWGEQMVGRFIFGSIGAIFGLLPMIGLLVFPFLAPKQCSEFFLHFLVFVITYGICMSILMEALKGVFQAALYFYATEGVSPDGFDEGEIQSSFIMNNPGFFKA